MHVERATQTLRNRQDLTRSEARAVMEQLFSGSVPDAEIAALLIALRDKGEKAGELVGFAEVMRERAAVTLRQAGVNLEAISQGGALLDTCGTGGDGAHTFNVSTATALVAAGAGARVAKHGNRSISSRCGSADLLEALGVAIDIPLKNIPACLEHTGIVFLFAPHLHLSMKHVMAARRSLKTKTVFNLLGPLTNPLRATHQLIGVYERARTELMAQTCTTVGTARAFVVAAHDGVDEISLTGRTQLSECAGGTIRTRDISPEDFGLPSAPHGSIQGGDAQLNAKILRSVLEGERGPYRDVVLMNTSAALVAAGKAPGFLQGVEVAASSIDSGAAKRTLAALVDFTRGCKH